MRNSHRAGKPTTTFRGKRCHHSNSSFLSARQLLELAEIPLEAQTHRSARERKKKSRRKTRNLKHTIPGQLWCRRVDHILNFHADLPGLPSVTEVSHLQPEVSGELDSQRQNRIHISSKRSIQLREFETVIAFSSKATEALSRWPLAEEDRCDIMVACFLAARAQLATRVEAPPFAVLGAV